MPSTFRPHAVVIVLGDLGRSPRMLNHARALRARGWRVTLAGFAENALPGDLTGDASVRVLQLGDGHGSRVAAVARLWRRLVTGEAWEAAIVQNPPGFPALFAAWLARRGRRASLVLDWHNLGATLLALRRPAGSPAVCVYAWCERATARLADARWAVSQALADALPVRGATVLHDAPAKAFCAAAVAEGGREAWWRRVWPEVAPPAPDAAWIVAPSGWGADEDTDAMLRVARRWRENAGEWKTRPLVVIATGRGPRQAAFARAAEDLRDGPVTLRMTWAPADEYPRLLAHAEAGLCLHTSSSGLDLPMKLADFRGAGCPALVRDYGPVLGEVFRDGRDGWRFRNDAELASLWRRVAAEPRGRTATEAATWEAAWTERLGAWAEKVEAGR